MQSHAALSGVRGGSRPFNRAATVSPMSGSGKPANNGDCHVLRSAPM